MFNLAAVLVLVAVFVAMADLLRHKMQTFGVTLAPGATGTTMSPATKKPA
jgi:hypothetical protein